ncbi:accessory Sec system translocase SecA2 [Microbacterium rhizomatis]|uniref:Protein translocase subunit SecA n=1 Tax=Microbacterium rhizomatis TaxID=1631477 RepID=A0A5J5J3X5_9MICO|nr:accessory Sec system translocase SecA2 [Microbacterium rhizomatis]KAA9110710.1 accessory Sec system translocase SecA2 [Microbacterium rhizomatis]
MRPPVPWWAAQILGLPGAVSFRRYVPIIRDANALEERMRALDDDALRAEAASLAFRTGERRLQREATARYLAVAREAAARTVGLRAFDEQLLGCCALLSGHAVEMDTGEGKTLVGALAAAGFAAAGRRVHVISVNDYLAERDATWMGPFFDLLGVSVGWIGQHTPHDDRRTAYKCDVVYAPVSEVGFDVLRDRFTVTPEERVAPVFDVAIIDEADSVMIDEAMVPLVLAGSSEHEADEFDHATALVEALVPDEDFTVDADQATASLTDDGLDRLEAKLGGINLYDVEHLGMFTRINLALHARVLVHRDVDYLVAHGKITLINTTRGRVAHLQRWPDGLHAALEAKEHLPVSAPGVILDQITIQDLLLQYKTTAGMSGTITAVAEELIEFYRLPAGRVERHEPNQRIDTPDIIVLTEEAKTAAIISDVTTRHQTGQPVLVGTQSVAESEALAARLDATGVPVRVLNAKNDAEEAEIVARAGEYGAVTISTQISGRGTDIRLGGSDGRDRDRVVKAGGLAVIATSRYPSRRLDAQLRGRAGRQGDPGVSCTFLSLDDDVIQLHATDRIVTRIHREQSTLPGVTRQKIADQCQAIAESQRTDRHRATWVYNRAIAAQRTAVLAHREEIIDSSVADGRVRDLIAEHWQRLVDARGLARVSETTRAVALFYLDEQWVSHLTVLQEIRDGIHLRALGGEKPADEFHRLALREFHGFFDRTYREVADFIAGLSPDDVGRDLTELGLRRPSATWTYMVTDDPYGNPGDRFIRRVGRFVRSTILNLE